MNAFNFLSAVVPWNSSKSSRVGIWKGAQSISLKFGNNFSPGPQKESQAVWADFIPLSNILLSVIDGKMTQGLFQNTLFVSPSQLHTKHQNRREKESFTERVQNKWQKS